MDALSVSSNSSTHFRLDCDYTSTTVRRKRHESLQTLGSKDLILEISDRNSSLIGKACGLYSNYDKCMRTTVFLEAGGKRCSPKAPLNSLARLGLSPFCDNETQAGFQKHRWCLVKLSKEKSLRACSSQIKKLGFYIQQMFEGGGAKSLCQIYYLIKGTFSCLEGIVQKSCGDGPLPDLKRVRDKVIATDESRQSSSYTFYQRMFFR